MDYSFLYETQEQVRYGRLNAQLARYSRLGQNEAVEPSLWDRAEKVWDEHPVLVSGGIVAAAVALALAARSIPSR